MMFKICVYCTFSNNVRSICLSSLLFDNQRSHKNMYLSRLSMTSMRSKNQLVDNDELSWRTNTLKSGPKSADSIRNRSTYTFVM